MSIRIKQWLEPPDFPGDEDKTAQARVINTVGLYFVVALIAGAVILVFFCKTQDRGLGHYSDVGGCVWCQPLSLVPWTTGVLCRVNGRLSVGNKHWCDHSRWRNCQSDVVCRDGDHHLYRFFA